MSSVFLMVLAIMQLTYLLFAQEENEIVRALSFVEMTILLSALGLSLNKGK